MFAECLNTFWLSQPPLIGKICSGDKASNALHRLTQPQPPLPIPDPAEEVRGLSLEPTVQGLHHPLDHKRITLLLLLGTGGRATHRMTHTCSNNKTPTHLCLADFSRQESFRKFGQSGTCLKGDSIFCSQGFPSALELRTVGW